MTGSDPREPQAPSPADADPAKPQAGRAPIDPPAARARELEDDPLADDALVGADAGLEQARALDDELDSALNPAAPTATPAPAAAVVTPAARDLPEDDDIDPSDYVDEAPPSAGPAPAVAVGAAAGLAGAAATDTPASPPPPPSPPSPPTPTPPAATPKRGGRAALLLSLLALLGLAALAGWGWYEQQRVSASLRAELDQRLAGLQTEVQQSVNSELRSTQAQVRQGLETVQQLRAELDRQLEAIRQAADPRPLLEPFESRLGRAESQVASTTARVDDLAGQQRQALEQMTQRLNGQQQRLLNLSTTNREDWLLAEARYLLRLANQRVLIEREPSTAIALLQSADAVLEEAAAGLGDPELFAVRRAVTADIAALQLVVEPDRNGLYLRLQALADQAGKLPTVPAHDLAPPSENPAPSTAETIGNWWQRGLDELKELAGAFDQYIRIQDVEAPQKPLLDQATAQVAALNIRLLLEQAQVALLRQEPTIYRESLTQAERLARHYFLEGEQVERFAGALNELAQVVIAPELPDISQSVELLHGYIQMLHQRGDDA